MRPQRRDGAKKNAKEYMVDFFEYREKRETSGDPQIEELAFKVIGAAIEVHRIIGPGLNESVYRRALSHELDLLHVPHACEFPVPVYYKGLLVGEGRMDLLVDQKLIVELKCVDRLNDVHRAQTISYLRATGFSLALLINFNVAVLKDGIKRIINANRKPI